MAKEKSVYSRCWHCGNNIYSREDRNYLHIREGQFSFCSLCCNQLSTKVESFLTPNHEGGDLC